MLFGGGGGKRQVCTVMTGRRYVPNRNMLVERWVKGNNKILGQQDISVSIIFTRKEERGGLCRRSGKDEVKSALFFCTIVSRGELTD
jgi:hypothetical protein